MMRFLSLFSLSILTAAAEVKTENVDAFKSMQFIVNENGFRVEQHQVVTTDGYILNVYRIPGKLEPEVTAKSKLPVLLVHGLGADMMQWVYNRPEVAPALVLARANYDVWMANNRGCRFSQTHLTLDASERAYWQFDWEDMGTKDTPMMIEYILKNTGAQKLNYIGHSEGTSQIMAGASLMPEFYNTKINVALLLAPVASATNIKIALIDVISKYALHETIEAIEVLHAWNLVPYGSLQSHAETKVCQLFDGKFCDLILESIADRDPSVDYTPRYDVYVSNSPSGGGYRSFAHYGQLIKAENQTFRRYDLGSAEANQARYGNDSPPDYDLSQLKFPIAIFSGSLDELANPKDVAWLSKKLEHTVIFNHEYRLGHMSFAIGKDMSFFTKDCMSILNNYNESTFTEMPIQ